MFIPQTHPKGTWKGTVANSEVLIPKYQVLASDLLADDEIHSILLACKDIKERAVIELLFESGCRAGELINLSIQDVSIDYEF